MKLTKKFKIPHTLRIDTQWVGAIHESPVLTEPMQPLVLFRAFHVFRGQIAVCRIILRKTIAGIAQKGASLWLLHLRYLSPADFAIIPPNLLGGMTDGHAQNKHQTLGKNQTLREKSS